MQSYNKEQMESKMLPTEYLRDVLLRKPAMAIVAFLSSTCPACQNFLPKWEAAQKQVEREHGKKLPLYTLDAGKYSRARYVPHVEVFEQGVPFVLENAQDPRVLLQYMRKVGQKSDASSLHKEEEEVEEEGFLQHGEEEEHEEEEHAHPQAQKLEKLLLAVYLSGYKAGLKRQSL